MNEFKNYKLVLIGDQDVGKTTLIQTYYAGKYPLSPEQSSGSGFVVKNLEEEGIKLQIWDFDEHNSDSTYHQQLFKGTHVIFVCFDITSESSLENCADWSNLANRYCPKIPRVMIGCKLDKRPQIVQPYIQEVAESAGIGKIRVCSARTGVNVEALFSEAILIAKNRY